MLKKIFLLSLILLAYCLSAGDIKELTTKLEWKIETVSEKNNYFINVKRDKLTANKKNIFILSSKYSKLLMFNHKGDFIKTLCKKGKGPMELNFPKNLWLLGEDKILIHNEIGQRFKEIDLKSMKERKFQSPYSFIGDLTFVEKNKLCVLTPFSMMPKVYPNDGHFLHYINISDMTKGKHFFPLIKQSDKKEAISYGEYGKGDMVYKKALIWVVFDQPDFIYIYDTKGKLYKKINSNFSYTKNNSAQYKQIKHDDGRVMTILDIDKKCRMNFLEIKDKLYLLTQINKDNKKYPDMKFYLSEIDIKNFKIKEHKKIKFNNIPKDIFFFNSFENHLIFANEDHIYCFEL